MKLPTIVTCMHPDWELNEAQELAVPYLQEKLNLVVATSTGSGKTTHIHMRGYKYLYKERKKILYVAPVKALVEEKFNLWTDKKHSWSQFNTLRLTGDYQIDPLKEAGLLERANIIVTTPEAWGARLRNQDSSRNQYLGDIGILVLDEFHMMGAEGRGANTEAAIIEHTYAYPKAELLCLSATMPNVPELTGWISTLNELDTVYIESTFRPVPLERKFTCIHTGQDERRDKISHVIRMLKEHPQDQFMIAVFSKAFGYELERAINDCRASSVCFYSADITDRATKARMEMDFLQKVYRCMIATTAALVGMNFPVKRMIVTAAKDAGGDIPAAVLNQAAGRAGRPGFDTIGYCEFLLPDKDFARHKQRIEDGEPVESQLTSAADVALHFLGAINLSRVHTREQFHEWYSRTLKQHQQPLSESETDELLGKIVDDMTKFSMIGLTDDGKYKLKRRGLIACQMSMDPYYLKDLIMNFKNYFSIQSPKPEYLARALGRCGPYYSNPPGQWQLKVIPQAVKDVVEPNYYMPVTAYYYALLGKQLPDAVGKVLGSTVYQFRGDIDRVCATLIRCDNECEKWNNDTVLKAIPHMVRQGVPQEIGILMSEGANIRQAKALFERGITRMTQLRTAQYSHIGDNIMRMHQ